MKKIIYGGKEIPQVAQCIRDGHPIAARHPRHKGCAYAYEARDFENATYGKAECSIPDFATCEICNPEGIY